MHWARGRERQKKPNIYDMRERAHTKKRTHQIEKNERQRGKKTQAEQKQRETH